MGLALEPNEVNNMISEMKSAIQGYNAELQDAIAPISAYSSENGLSGVAYTNSKHHMEDHITVINGAIVANGEFVSCLNKLLTAVGSERLIEDELMETINSCEKSINQYERQRDYYQSILTNPAYEMTVSWYARSRINNCNKMIGIFNEIKRKTNEKIDKLYEISGQISGIFGSATSIYGNVKCGIQSLDSGRDAVGFTPRVAGKWRTELNKSVSEFENAEIKRLEEQAEKDYKDGKISFDVYQSIRDGLRHTGFAFLREAVVKQVTDTTSKAIADSMYSWLINNTTIFMDRGLVGALATGGDVLIRETPSSFTQFVRGLTRPAVPIIGTALDFEIMKSRGESTGDALVKSVSHTAIALGGAKIGAIIGTAIGPVGTVGGAAIGAAIGFVIGIAGNMTFDYLYDDRDKLINGAKKIVPNVGEGAKKLGNCVCKTFGSIGSVLFGR